jgi:hypothetical protein
MRTVEHPLLTVLNSAPINKQAAIVTSQRHVATADTPLTRDELAALANRLLRKQRLLKHVLGIKTKRQHKNMTYKAAKGIPQYRAAKEPRALTEYLRCGREIQRLAEELADMRRVRRFVAEAENECKALMAQRTTTVEGQ